ncbi:type II toxin-antitoxin system VapC family toxin [Rhabdochromatium marinum]|uniref:type II toxin-antitoxin system VapC family toxin n=1 Tax=Rhabdochromatium marinum TaxID=48729 RepID=UPI00190408A1|nr:type II toxin-antitoxin system VapC family toxin [Rhabdochromatium marinum]MBK1648585.1 VapC toxin family PIN domain ribonuclease [Rhabdochromatium marinum]
MHYLLDTSIIIAAIRGDTQQIRDKLDTTSLSEIVLSPVVMGELELSVENRQCPEINRARLDYLVEGLRLKPINAETSLQYGAIRAELERLGAPIDSNDCWIAAQALELEAILVTADVDAFSRVPGLVVENWLVETW